MKRTVVGFLSKLPKIDRKQFNTVFFFGIILTIALYFVSLKDARRFFDKGPSYATQQDDHIKIEKIKDSIEASGVAARTIDQKVDLLAQKSAVNNVRLETVETVVVNSQPIVYSLIERLDEIYVALSKQSPRAISNDAQASIPKRSTITEGEKIQQPYVHVVEDDLQSALQNLFKNKARADKKLFARYPDIVLEISGLTQELAGTGVGRCSFIATVSSASTMFLNQEPIKGQATSLQRGSSNITDIACGNAIGDVVRKVKRPV